MLLLSQLQSAQVIHPHCTKCTEMKKRKIRIANKLTTHKFFQLYRTVVLQVWESPSPFLGAVGPSLFQIHTCVGKILLMYFNPNNTSQQTVQEQTWESKRQSAIKPGTKETCKIIKR